MYVSSVQATKDFAAARVLIVEGAVNDLYDLKTELDNDFSQGGISIGDITETRADLFDHDEFGASPTGEVVIQIIANVGSAAIISMAQAIIHKVLKRPKLRIKEHPDEGRVDTNESE
jgi:hypothetical protein